ncbi:PHP domain-containing protein [Geosporobacter ferrireducens]|uniref:Phosphatase n=1 Tax=Geosporobacter ferrireducens TaxID=1424294 RepID=A0A1D8GNI2_9FIRM|nr:PHP domain-containing protein [Geosporobacter ferrireducens]AOT72491.1 phosphatase [Geosporobacter ferrireducens]MTI58213.1 PHP domain-containing protein [Geosporobacter ferrireducens]
MKIDLHIHSNYSDDGEFTVKEILELSKKNHIEIISLTDHNSVRGIEEAITYGKENHIEVIPGIEIDCIYNGLNLHLLGYGFDFTHEDYKILEENVYQQEMKFAYEKIEKISNHTDLIVDKDKILKQANGRIITGELIAEVIINNPENHKKSILLPYLEGGSRSDMPNVNFYWDFFSQGKIAYIPIEYISLKEAIDLIEGTGGIPVIAHPGNNLRNKENLIYKLIHEGIKGMEVYSSYHSDEQIDYFLSVAKEKGLFITCGTDFHGKNKPNIQLGYFKQSIDFQEIIRKLKG